MAGIKECEFRLVKHPPYLPDLTPSEYYLFPGMKEELTDNHFATDNITAAVDDFLKAQNTDSYKDGIRMLHNTSPSV